ncbi:MAG: hypothetical protein ACK4NH_11535, partial [Gemmobacter sp.]
MMTSWFFPVGGGFLQDIGFFCNRNVTICRKHSFVNHNCMSTSDIPAKPLVDAGIFASIGTQPRPRRPQPAARLHIPWQTMHSAGNRKL